MGIDYSVKLALFQGQTKSGHSLMLNIDQCKCQHACLALEERLLRTMGGLNWGINQASLLRTRHSPWQSRWTSSSPFSEVLNPPHSFRTLPRQLKFTHYLPCAQYPMQWMNTLFPVCVLFDLQTPLLELIQREGAVVLGVQQRGKGWRYILLRAAVACMDTHGHQGHPWMDAHGHP